MTQNLQAIISLCFGPTSHSTVLLASWAEHMYKNRIMYKSLQASDKTFLTQVLFAIDHALQIHWRSCCDASDCSSVNDKILLMHEKQDSITQYNFTYRLPTAILDKITETLNSKESGKVSKKYKWKGKNGKFEHKNQITSLKDIVTDNDPSHLRWWIKENENFSRTFYFNSKHALRLKMARWYAWNSSLEEFVINIALGHTNSTKKMNRPSILLSIDVTKKAPVSRIFNRGQWWRKHDRTVLDSALQLTFSPSRTTQDDSEESNFITNYKT